MFERINESNGEYCLIIGSGCCERSRFVKALRVEGNTYAEALADRMYDSLLAHSIDVLEEYRKYYTDEYSTLDVYLYWNYQIDHPILEKIMSDLRPGESLRWGSVFSGGDYALGQLIMTDRMSGILDRILGELREGNREDQSRLRHK